MSLRDEIVTAIDAAPADNPMCMDAAADAILALVRAHMTSAEPVAWAYVNPDGECEQIEWGPVFDDPYVTPLYASPPAPESK